MKASRTSYDDPVWTLSDEEVTARGQAKEQTEFEFREEEEEKEQAGVEDVLKEKAAETIFSARDLVSVSEANRPSMDQMLPTRYSQLLLDSHASTSNNHNCNTN